MAPAAIIWATIEAGQAVSISPALACHFVIRTGKGNPSEFHVHPAHDDARHLAVIWRGALSRTPQRSSFSSGFVSGTYVGGSFSSPRNRMAPQLHPNWMDQMMMVGQCY